MLHQNREMKTSGMVVGWAYAFERGKGYVGLFEAGERPDMCQDKENDRGLLTPSTYGRT